jgi:hypothetical protein
MMQVTDMHFKYASGPEVFAEVKLGVCERLL